MATVKDMLLKPQNTLKKFREYLKLFKVLLRLWYKLKQNPLNHKIYEPLSTMHSVSQVLEKTSKSSYKLSVVSIYSYPAEISLIFLLQFSTWCARFSCKRWNWYKGSKNLDGVGRKCMNRQKNDVGNNKVIKAIALETPFVYHCLVRDVHFPIFYHQLVVFLHKYPTIPNLLGSSPWDF